MLKTALIDVLSAGTWNDIEADHAAVGLPWREDLEPGWGKPKYVQRVLADLAVDELVGLAQRCAQTFPDRAQFALQDALWWMEADGVAVLSEVTRLNVAARLDGRVMDPHLPADEFMGRFAAGAAPATSYDSDQLVTNGAVPLDFVFGLTPHHTSEPEPYSHRELLDCFGFRSWPDRRVFHFLEALVHPRLRQGPAQQEWVVWINSTIGADGLQLLETDRVSGQPILSLRPRDRGVAGKPKNLVFASTGPKPEIGFGDAINNDIVILKHAEHCLVYDDAITDEGLRWEHLAAWWADREEARKDGPGTRQELGRRLMESLGSPAEQRFFESYFRTQSRRLGDSLPALLPQVYLHYDPVTVRELRSRGEDRRFLAQRMDFLLLLPDRVRVVLEVDGQQHYSDRTGAASPATYADTVRADRALRLVGYEVYRFSGHELYTPELARRTVSEFFDRLFARHRLP